MANSSDNPPPAPSAPDELPSPDPASPAQVESPTPTAPGQSDSSTGGKAPRPAPFGSLKTPRFLKPLVRRPRVSDRVSTWLVVMLALLLAAPAMFIDLHRPDVVDADEARALSTSVQTLDRQADLRNMTSWTPWSGDYWTPTLNGVLDLSAPPATTWLQLVALQFADRPTGSAPQSMSEVRAGRTLSAIMGLVVIASVFWAGHSIGGLRTGWLSALVCGTNPLIIWYARLASPEILYAGWALLSIAAALWALRPLRPSPTVFRQALGWVICGAAMAMACLSAGPGALPAVAVPIFLFVFLCPNRLSHTLGLLAALLMAVLLVMPWAVYAHQQDPSAWPVDPMAWAPRHWLDPHELFLTSLSRLPWLLLASLPWVIWLPGAVIQPFSTSSSGVRVRMFLGWSWFLVAAVICLGATESGWRACLVVATVAASVLIAQIFQQYIDRTAEGRPPRTWRVLRWPHAALLLAASIIGPWLQYSSSMPGIRSIVPAPVTADFGPAFSALVCAGLVGLVIVGFQFAIANFPSKAVGIWGVWALLFNLALLMPIIHGPMSASVSKADGQLIHAFSSLAHEQRVFWLDLESGSNTATRPDALSGFSPDPVPKVQPEAQMVFYFGEPLIGLRPDQFDALEEKNYFVLAPQGALRSGGPFVFYWRFKRAGVELWKVTGK